MSKYAYEGLTDAQVEESRNEHGANGLPPPESETFWEKLMENFDVRAPCCVDYIPLTSMHHILCSFLTTNQLEG